MYVEVLDPVQVKYGHWVYPKLVKPLAKVIKVDIIIVIGGLC